MKVFKIILWAFLILALTMNAGAARVGVVVSLPNGETITECVEVGDNTDGYQVMLKTNLDIAWSDGGIWGHGLCGIEGVGCPSDDCYCGGDNYWGFHVFDGSRWNYMPVGWDAGDDCWNGEYTSYDGHYCARDGDVLGYGWGVWGTQPAKKSFEELCPQKTNSGRGLVTEINGEVALKEFSTFSGELIRLSVMDETDLKPLEDYTVEVSTDSLKKVLTLESGGDSMVEFSLDEPGRYRLLIMARGRTHEQVMLRIDAKTSTTSLTSTSTVPPETSSTTLSPTTTIELEHLNIEEAQASTTTSTIELETTSTVNLEESTTITAESEPKLVGMVVETKARRSNGGLYVTLFIGFLIACYLVVRK